MPTKTSNSKSAWSAKDIYDMIFSTYGNAHVNANKARAKEASKYMIPYIPEKEIMLTTGRYNTGKISTNLLDSIYDSSKRTGVPLDIALGLAGRESTLGIGRGFKRGKSVSGTDLYSNWQQIQTIPNDKAQMKRWNSLLGRTNLTDEDYDFKSEFLIRAQNALENTKSLDEHPIDNALKFYQTGKYNPGDKNHSKMVEEDGKVLMSDPAIQKWLKTKTETQMKCGGRRKAQLGLDIREGGVAIPIANNMFYINGRKHAAGGVAIGPNNKNGVEVEGGEVVEMIDSNHPSVGRQFKTGGQQQTMRVFSSVPFLRGVSPAQLVMEGANPNAVFKAQEEFKDRNRINDDGTTYEVGGEKNININNLPSSFRGRKIGNSYYQIGIPPSTNKIKSGVTGFKNYLKGLNDDLDEFGVTFTQVSKKVMPKPLRDTYAKLVNAIYKTNKIDKINTAANQIGTVSMVTDKKKFGGNMIYEINGNVRNGLNLRSKAQYGKTIKIDKASYETVDEAVERYKQLYRIRYGKEPSESDINRIAWIKSLENAIDGNPNLITGYGPNVGVRGPNVTKIVSGANKGRQIARTQTVVRNKNVKSAAPQRQAINTKVSQAARAERQSQFDVWQQGEAFKASTMPTDAVAVNRPTISTAVRSGRKGRVDDVVAIERSQRSVDPLSSKSEFSVYDKAYAKKANNKMNQFTNILLASGTGGIIAGNATYDYLVGDTIYNEELPVQNNNQTNESVNTNIKTQNKPSNKAKINQNHTINGTFDNARPQYYAEKRLPIAGNQSIAEKAGLARSGWSYGENPTFDYVPNINISVPTNYAKAVGDNSKISTSSTASGRGTKASTPKAASQSTPTIQDTVNKITTDAWKASKTPKIDLSKAKMPTYNVSDLGSKETKAAKDKVNNKSSKNELKNTPWIGQYKTFRPEDWVGLGTNLAGHIAGYFANNSLLKKYPMPVKPVSFQAAKLKTTHNINPKLAAISETEQMNLAEVGHNTSSSSTSIARKQRIMNEARDARNKLYGEKENIETQLINLDRRNRQDVYNRNVAAYNDWLDKTYAAKSNNLLNKQRNLTNLISGIPMAVNNMLGTIESRRATNNTLRAIAAANPNVDARLIGGFDYYVDPITKKKYNKNQQYVGTING